MPLSHDGESTGKSKNSKRNRYEGNGKGIIVLLTAGVRMVDVTAGEE
jgi:hypothetical protein